MNSMSRNYTFFESKKKNKKQTPAHNNSRSMSSHSDFGKKSGRISKPAEKKPVISQKEKEIREAIQYRFAKSKIRDYQYGNGLGRGHSKRSLSRSSQEEEFKELKGFRYMNLKEYHEKAQKKKIRQGESQKLRSRLKLRTNGSLIIKTQPNQNSMDKIKALNPYLKSQNKKMKAEDWRFISIQFKEKSKSKTKEVKVNSHRTLTAQVKSIEKMKSSESKWAASTKLKDLGKLATKYRF